MTKPIDRDHTIEKQIWADIASRVQWFTAKQVARKLMVSVNYTRLLCESYYKREILDKKVMANTNYYRVKP